MPRLVLTRKDTQKIHVNGPCVFEIVETSKGRVKIAIIAAPETRIDRGEVHQQREIERKAA